MGDIGDVHGEGPAARGFLQPDSVVVVFGIGRIDGDDQLVTPIFAAGDFRRLRLIRHAAGGSQHLLGKRRAQAKPMDHGDHVHAGIARPAEDFDDAPARGLRAVAPLC